MNIQIITPKSGSLPAELGGKKVSDLRAETKLQVAEVNGDKSGVKGFDDVSILTVAVCRKIVAAGGDVLNYPAFIEFTEPKEVVGPPMPEDDGGTTLGTWGTHDMGKGLQTNAPVKLDGKFYKALTMGVGGFVVPASQWPVDSETLRVISSEEYKSVQRIEE